MKSNCLTTTNGKEIQKTKVKELRSILYFVYEITNSYLLQLAKRELREFDGTTGHFPLGCDWF